MKKNSIMFISMITIISILYIVIPDQSISYSERRGLETLPDMTIEGIMSGDYFESFERYMLDQMPFRDTFKSFKSYFASYVLRNKDVNGYYKDQDHIFKIELNDRPEMHDYFNQYIDDVIDYYSFSRVFLAVIPDKNYFTDHPLNIDYSRMKKALISDNYIDLFQVLKLEDYYLTDPHWKQENLDMVLETLAKEMDFELLEDFDIKQYDFTGAYGSQSAFGVKELLSCLMNPLFEDLIVKHYDKDETLIYDTEKLDGIDPYDVFLSGGSPIVEMINEQSTSDRELIIFRDSYASSLAPLMMKTYHKITLVDTRYVPYEYLSDYIDIDNQEVLFLYSSMVVNNSIMLR